MTPTGSTADSLPPPGDLGAQVGALAEVVGKLRSAVEDETAERKRQNDLALERIEAADRARQESDRARRLATLAGGVAVAAALAGALVSLWLVFQIRGEVRERQIAQCEASNAARAAIVDMNRADRDALVKASSRPNATPEEVARREAVIAEYDALRQPALDKLAPRVCSAEALGLD